MNATSIIALITALGPVIQGLGTSLPSLIPGLGTIFGSAPTVTNNSVVKLLQGALNADQALGKVKFDGQAGQPNSPLVVDGNFGGRTFAAVKAFQSQLGWTVTEPLASIEMNLLATLLSKL